MRISIFLAGALMVGVLSRAVTGLQVSRLVLCAVVTEDTASLRTARLWCTSWTFLVSTYRSGSISSVHMLEINVYTTERPVKGLSTQVVWCIFMIQAANQG